MGRISKDKILKILLGVSIRLPEISELNKELDINWSGQFALDAFFPKLKGETIAVLLCSDFTSLDLVGYLIADRENYYSWRDFLTLITPELAKQKINNFFVTDGKRGLHQALKELFPDVPNQLCISHKQRRLNQIVPRIRGDGYDKLFSHLAHQAVKAPLKEIFKVYFDILIDFQRSDEYPTYPQARQEKLKRIIGALRFQRNKLHTRYDHPDIITDPTTNHLEGINSFLKERLDLMRGFKKEENARLLLKLLVYYYRFHKFTSSKFKERNRKAPIELNRIRNQQLLDKILKGKEPYSWLKNLLSGT